MCSTRIMETNIRMLSSFMALVCHGTEGVIHYRVAPACCPFFREMCSGKTVYIVH